MRYWLFIPIIIAFSFKGVMGDDAEEMAGLSRSTAHVVSFEEKSPDSSQAAQPVPGATAMSGGTDAPITSPASTSETAGNKGERNRIWKDVQNALVADAVIFICGICVFSLLSVAGTP